MCARARLRGCRVGVVSEEARLRAITRCTVFYSVSEAHGECPQRYVSRGCWVYSFREFLTTGICDCAVLLGNQVLYIIECSDCDAGWSERNRGKSPSSRKRSLWGNILYWPLKIVLGGWPSWLFYKMEKVNNNYGIEVSAANIIENAFEFYQCIYEFHSMWFLCSKIQVWPVGANLCVRARVIIPVIGSLLLWSFEHISSKSFDKNLRYESDSQTNVSATHL